MHETVLIIHLVIVIISIIKCCYESKNTDFDKKYLSYRYMSSTTSCTMKERILQISSTMWSYVCCEKKPTLPKDVEPEVIDLPRVNTPSSCKWLNWCMKNKKSK